MGLLSNHADRAIRTATIAYTGCHTQNRVAGNRHSGWMRIHIRTTAVVFRIHSGWTRIHIRTTAGMSHIRIRSFHGTRADTRADVPCD